MGGGRGVGGSPCEVCQAACSLACGGCGEVYYCNREHQRKHWAQHRALCRPYKEVQDPKLGRYIVASRRLKAGQHVMEDLPLALGPLAVTELVCLGCNSYVGADLPRCPGCWWPMCSPECAVSNLHQEECAILARDTDHFAIPKECGEMPHYDIILLLRMLLLRSSNPKAWEVVLNMEHHSEKRREANQMDLKMVVHVIQNVLDLDYTAEEVEQVHGAIATNAMQICSPNDVPLRVMHPSVRLFNHSCCPNLQLSFTNEGKMLVRTALTLEAGEPLYVTYTEITMPLWERRVCLKENYFFSCECPRCSDPTELDTNFSNPLCSECRLIMQPRTWLGVISWVCQRCKAEKSEERMRDEANSLLFCLDMNDVADAGSRRLQYMLEQVEMDYHPMHYLWMRVAQRTLHMLHNDESERGLKLRLTIWKKLVALYSKLEPGLTRRRGMSLLELGLSLMKTMQQEYSHSHIYLTYLIDHMTSVVGYFQEAEDIMSLEPPNTRFHVLAERARARKEQAKDFLVELENEKSKTK